MSTEFGKFINLLQEVDEEPVSAPASAPAPAVIKFDQRKFIPWLAKELKAYPEVITQLTKELEIDVSGDVWQVREIVETVRNLQPQQHVYIYANMKGQWPAIFTTLGDNGMQRLERLVKQPFTPTKDTVGKTVYTIDDQEGVDKYIQIISEMAEWPESESVSEEVEAVLTELPYIKLIIEHSKEQKGKWWQLPGVNKIVNWSKKLDRKNQIQNTVNDMEAAKVIEMLTAIDTALNKVAADRLAGAPRTKTSTGRDIPLTMSNVPEGDIIEELFGFGAGTMDLGKLQKLAIELIKSKPDDDKTKAVVALIVDAAMSHKESDTIYDSIQNLPQLKLMASVIAKGKPIKAKQAESQRAEHEINQQRIRDKYPGLSDTEIAAKQRQEIDDQRKKLGLDSVQTRFSKFTSLLTSHLANDQKDS